MTELLPQITSAASMLVLYVVLIVLAKLINDLSTPYHVDEELAQKDNFALACSFSGYLLATTIIFIATLLGPAKDLLTDLITVGGYTFLGILLLNVSRVINDKVLLYKFCNIQEIIEDRNAGTGVAQLGSYIASALVIAGALHGEGGGVETALVFFLIGQIMLLIVSRIYDFITPYDIHHEIADNNTAAGLAYSGTLIAVGILLMKGSSGNFISWQHNLSHFAVESLIAIVILPIFRWILDKIIIRKIDLNKEISDDRNVGAGLLEMSVIIGFASILYFLY